MSSLSSKPINPKARPRAAAASQRPATKPKRELFSELSEGFHALADARSGKRTLRTHAIAFRPAPELTPAELVSLRRKLDVSLPVFASYLRTNARTIENWEQGPCDQFHGYLGMPGEHSISR